MPDAYVPCLMLSNLDIIVIIKAVLSSAINGIEILSDGCTIVNRRRWILVLLLVN